MQAMQDNLRSAVYRSLTKTVPISSEDCNGTIEFRTRTKPKTSSFAGMELRRDEEEEKAMAYDDYTALQLFQVSRGAQKLSQMIEFWSKTAPIQYRKSQGFAQDLLRGALDLQESLLVLKNLRDSSNLSARMNPTTEPDTLKSYYGEEETFKQDLCSKFCSSVNCVEELEQTTKSTDRSSRSLRFTMSDRFDQFVVKEDLVCSGGQPYKANASTLLAKLMGLEEVPSKKPMHSPTRDGEIKKKRFSYNIYAKEENALEKDSNIRTTSSYRTQQKEIEQMETAIAESFSAKKTLATVQRTQQKEMGIMTRVKLHKQPEAKGNERKMVKNAQASKHLSKSASKPARHDKVLHSGKTDAYQRARAQEDQLKSASKLVRKVRTNSNDRMNTSRAKSIRPSTKIKTKSHEEIKCRDGKKFLPNSETCGASVLGNNSLCNQPFEQIAQYRKPYSEVQEYKESISCHESMADDIDQKVRCDIMAKASQHGSSTFLLENTVQIAETSSSIGKIDDMENDIRYTLLTCQSFYSSAKEHFGLHPSKSFYSQSNTAEDKVGVQNDKLLPDLAEELMARRSHWHKHRFSPFLQTHHLRRTIGISLYKIVQEISSAVNKLACYSAGCVTERCSDILYIRLEKDLQCEDITMNSIWDIGWLNDVCLEAAEEAIDEIGDSILSRLIHEEVIELVSLCGPTKPFSKCSY